MDSFKECWFHFKSVFQSKSMKMNDMTVIVRLWLSLFDVASLSYSHVKGDRQHWQASSSTMDSTHVAHGCHYMKGKCDPTLGAWKSAPLEKILSFLDRIPTDASCALCFRAPRGPAFESCLSSALSVCMPHLNRCEALRHKSHTVLHLLHTTILCHKGCCS